MTDFDYEILKAIAQYGEKGVTQAELESKHFSGYTLIYNLIVLSEHKPIGTGAVKITVSNDTVLDSKRENVKILSGGIESYTSRYFIIHRGQSLLNNWLRRNRRAHILHFAEGFIFALMGALLGIILGPMLAPFIKCLSEVAKGKILSSLTLLFL